MLFFDILDKKCCLQDCNKMSGQLTVFFVIFNQCQTQVNKLFNTSVQLKIISESLESLFLDGTNRLIVYFWIELDSF